MKIAPSDRELIVVLLAVFVVLASTLGAISWIRYLLEPDRGECLVQHREEVEETWFNGVTFDTQRVSRMVRDVWEHPEGL